MIIVKTKLLTIQIHNYAMPLVEFFNRETGKTLRSVEVAIIGQGSVIINDIIGARRLLDDYPDWFSGYEDYTPTEKHPKRTRLHQKPGVEVRKQEETNNPS